MARFEPEVMRSMVEHLVEYEEDDRLLFWLRSGIVGAVRANVNLRQLAVLLVGQTAKEPKSITALAAILSINNSSTARAIDRLAAEGLVRRIPDPADGRAVLVEVTQSGHLLCRRLGKAGKASPPGKSNTPAPFE
jgi:DNA-binding MarR family transcriptional regulator